jgi:hypothetical protein
VNIKTSTPYELCKEIQSVTALTESTELRVPENKETSAMIQNSRPEAQRSAGMVTANQGLEAASLRAEESA